MLDFSPENPDRRGMEGMERLVGNVVNGAPVETCFGRPD